MSEPKLRIAMVGVPAEFCERLGVRLPGRTHLVVGFESRAEAERFLEEFRERLAKFGLELHPEKTRLIEFGRFAAPNREKRGEGKPETFTFLGFTHYCGKRRKDGALIVWRETAKKRLVAKLQEIETELKHRRHEPIPFVGAWLRQVTSGYYQYHAVPGNLPRMQLFRWRLSWLWCRALSRRGQRQSFVLPMEEILGGVTGNAARAAVARLAEPIVHAPVKEHATAMGIDVDSVVVRPELGGAENRVGCQRGNGAQQSGSQNPYPGCHKPPRISIWAPIQTISPGSPSPRLPVASKGCRRQSFTVREVGHRIVRPRIANE
jgi:hypothetical protein